MSRPIIGIVTKHPELKEKQKAYIYIKDEYKQAIFDNGGIAIGILPVDQEVYYCIDNWDEYYLSKENRNKLYAQIDLCDGILLQGGFRSDQYEPLIARYCYDHDIPLLGICAGQNCMSRAFGGTTKPVADLKKHNNSKKYAHDINIDSNSKFYQIVKTEKMAVNSWHHRNITDFQELKVAAYCEDGYPDVIEAKNKMFYLGVRFHPEVLYLEDQNMQAIFISFIEACKKYQERKK
ncbi:gamma-glutamyl-gamma-aminobutyrate hydrolase family protein [Thomasclavelia sp.]|uniref:gamma-glutamyl-gamma-aminobutyrate hydrolase family protein n=1 Tax=Thomasclavelia sp. TaxID=3025757 RepID=UPI0025F118BD|nr:gamma-glutamyl-gamma-aminobutyrate hydrolase family protein [Thomasclavelia sp.]